jgi:hypothetical protein
MPPCTTRASPKWCYLSLRSDRSMPSMRKTQARLRAALDLPVGFAAGDLGHQDESPGGSQDSQSTPTTRRSGSGVKDAVNAAVHNPRITEAVLPVSAVLRKDAFQRKVRPLRAGPAGRASSGSEFGHPDEKPAGARGAVSGAFAKQQERREGCTVRPVQSQTFADQPTSHVSADGSTSVADRKLNHTLTRMVVDFLSRVY